MEQLGGRVRMRGGEREDEEVRGLTMMDFGEDDPGDGDMDPDGLPRGLRHGEEGEEQQQQEEEEEEEEEEGRSVESNLMTTSSSQSKDHDLVDHESYERQAVPLKSDLCKHTAAKSKSKLKMKLGSKLCQNTPINSLPDQIIVRILEDVVNCSSCCTRALSQCSLVCKWFSSLSREISSLSFCEQSCSDVYNGGGGGGGLLDPSSTFDMADVTGSNPTTVARVTFADAVARTVLKMRDLQSLRIKETCINVPGIFGLCILEEVLCHVGQSLEELVLERNAPGQISFLPLEAVVRLCCRLKSLSLSASSLYIQGLSLGEEVTRMALSSNGYRTDTWKEYSSSDPSLLLKHFGGSSSTLKHLEINGMLSDFGFEETDKPLPCFKVLSSLFPNLESLSVTFSRGGVVGMACVEVNTLSKLKSLKISAPRPLSVQGGAVGFTFLASVVVDAPRLSSVEIDGVYSLTIKGKAKIDRLVMEAVPDVDVDGGPRVFLGENVSLKTLIISGMKKQDGGSCSCRTFDQEYGWTWERLRELLSCKEMMKMKGDEEYPGLQTLVLRELPICDSAPAVLPVARAELIGALILTGGDVNFASMSASILSIGRSLKTLRRLEIYGLSLIGFLIRRPPPPPPGADATCHSRTTSIGYGGMSASSYMNGHGGGGITDGTDDRLDDRTGDHGSSRQPQGQCQSQCEIQSRDEVLFRAPFLECVLLEMEERYDALEWIGPRLVPLLSDILAGSPCLKNLTVRIDRSKTKSKPGASSSPTAAAARRAAMAEVGRRVFNDDENLDCRNGCDIFLDGVERIKRKHGDKVLKIVFIEPTIVHENPKNAAAMAAAVAGRVRRMNDEGRG